MLAIFLTIGAACLVVLVGVVVAAWPYWRAFPLGRHHGGGLRAAGIVAPGTGGGR